MSQQATTALPSDAAPYTATFLQVGDPGGQHEIVPLLGPLTVGLPDSNVDFADCHPWQLRACTTRGMTHRYAGTPRQDYYAVAVEDDWVVAAVCDGVGQGRDSHVAAETASRALCKLVADAAKVAGAKHVDWEAIAQRTSRRIIEEARYRQLVRFSDDMTATDQLRAVRSVMATTAVVVMVARTHEPDGTIAGALALIAGDSGAYRLGAGGLQPLIGGKDGADLITSTAVRPLPGVVQPQVVEFRAAPGEAVILVTDGLGDPLGEGNTPLGTVLSDCWRTPPTPGALLDQVNFLMRSYDDDRTAVGLWASTIPDPWPSSPNVPTPGSIPPPGVDETASCSSDEIPNEPSQAATLPIVVRSAHPDRDEDERPHPGAPNDAHKADEGK